MQPRPRSRRSVLAVGAGYLSTALVVVLLLAAGLFSLPTVIAIDMRIVHEDTNPRVAFPITVDPVTQTITEDPHVEALLEQKSTKLQAAANNAGEILTLLASWISSLPMYQSIASVGGASLVTIRPGYREEQVVNAFANELGWTDAQKRAFAKQLHASEPTMVEGQFVPDTYALRSLMTPTDVQLMLDEKFKHDIEDRYSSTTEEIVPLNDALTIASMLEKETSDPTEMRLISGIIWNRLWKGMNLQIDATLQYAKANSSTNVKTWWPPVVPKDKYIKSVYNTYQNKGLPPGPIANPSLTAVLAAINPKNTDCLFYFHDRHGGFHCSPTYKGHVTMLKQYYGQGK